MQAVRTLATREEQADSRTGRWRAGGGEIAGRHLAVAGREREGLAAVLARGRRHRSLPRHRRALVEPGRRFFKYPRVVWLLEPVGRGDVHRLREVDLRARG